MTAFPNPFRRLSLSAKLIGSYLVILGIGGLAITGVGSWIVSHAILAEASRTVRHDLAIARAVYGQQILLTRKTLEVAATGPTIPTFLAATDTTGLLRFLEDLRLGSLMDFVGLADADGSVILRAASPLKGDAELPAVVAEALRTGAGVAGAELMSAEALRREHPPLETQARILLVPTPRAGPTPSAGEVTDGLVLLGAAPVRDTQGRVRAVLYGGRLVNRNAELVDRVWSDLYRDDGQSDGRGGTVTIFLRDVRVSTNVRTEQGDRALGTRVSREVRDAVLVRGESWNGRAFVVDQWYITAYQPLRGLSGEVLGMLYVGLPEASYVATRNQVILSFLGIATVGFLLVLSVTYLGIQRLMRPLGQMVDATRSIAAGDFDHEVPVDPRSEGEISRLAGSFNLMLQGLRDMRADLEEWGRTLEEKVHDRTEELVRMQARVSQSERLASLGMLAAGVAHEINNPLGGVLTLTALTLEDLPEGNASRANLEEVVRQTERCRDIVKHLLEFSRQTEVAAAEVDLNEVVARTLALLRRQAAFFNVDVVDRLEPGLPRVLADASQLQQVFMNIIMNAVQAMEERGTLTIESRGALDSDGEVEVSFTDTGCGIREEDLDRVFDPFFTTGKGMHGTGLGLSIAYGIVSKHHGTITVESAVGVGTTFTVRLPAVPDV
jgi:two-component system NtrC family sensor kinase